jgi:osmotically-inducible protein OsmY
VQTEEAAMATRTDRDIVQYVQEELRYDFEIDSTDIGVSAKNGVVTLSGVDHRYMDKVPKSSWKMAGCASRGR